MNRKINGDITLAVGQYVAEENYWLNKLAGDLVLSYFPGNHQPGYIDNASAAEVVHTRLPGQLAAKLIKLMNGSDPRLFMILVSGLTLLLHKYTGNTDIIVCAPIYKQETEGEFINTVLTLRNRVEDEMTFKELLMQVRQTIIEADENQNYPLDILVYQLNRQQQSDRLSRSNLSTSFFNKSDPSVHPLFDVAVLLKNIHSRGYLKVVTPQMVFSFARTQENVEVELEYNPYRYKRSNAEEIINCYTRLLQQALTDVNIKIAEMEMLSEEERKQLLDDFNDTRSPYPEKKTIHGLLEEQVERTPHHTAVVGPGIGAAVGITGTSSTKSRTSGSSTTPLLSLTYQELNRRANLVAWFLSRKGVGPDGVVGIMMERSLEMVTAMIAVLKAGGAYLPLETDLPKDRIAYMLEDSQVKWVISTPPFTAEPTKKYQWIDFQEGVGYGEASQGSNPGKVNRYRDLAYVMYTSGTTGKPKGVMVEHRNVTNLLTHFGKLYQVDHSTHVLQFAPYTFDPSVEQIFGTLLHGGTVLMMEEHLVGDPDRFFGYIEKNQVHILNLIPLLLKELLPQREKPRCVRAVISGGDQLKEEVKHRLLEKKYLLYNHYGPTETTVEVITGRCTDDEVSLGTPIANTRCYILDKADRLMPIGLVGELFISGAGVARGYVNRPGLTHEKFTRNPFLKSERMYKTGDFARWRSNGTIEYFGRRDHQVKIRGQRIELGEIEALLSKKEGINEAAAAVKENKNGEQYLCAYIVSNLQFNTSDLNLYLAKYLPASLFPMHFVPLKKLPLTANGKIDRKALPEPESFCPGSDYVPPRNTIEKKLVKIWSEVLGVEKNTISVDSNFFELGGHSLKAFLLESRMQKEFAVKVTLADIFKAPQINDLAEIIKRGRKSDYISIEPAETKDYYPLPVPHRKIFMDEMKTKSVQYSGLDVFVIWGKLDKKRFNRAINKIVQRHEMLRTSFHLVEAGVVQRINDIKKINVSFGKCSEPEVKERIAQFKKPFDLSKAPLLRVELLQIEKEKYFVLFNIHHIVIDAVSLQIMIKEIIALYENRPLPPLPLQFKDYAVWYNSPTTAKSIANQEVYWRDKMKNFKYTSLPVDNPNPLDNKKCKSEIVEIDKLGYREIETFCNQYSVTRFTFLMAVFQIILAREIGQDDLTIGIRASSRAGYEMGNTFGYFLNKLLIRSIINYNDTFLNHVLKVNETIIESMDNALIPYESLEVKLREENKLAVDRLFTIKINYLPPEENIEEIFNLPIQIKPYDIGKVSSKYDIALTIRDFQETLELNLIYNSARCASQRIKRMMKGIESIIRQVIEKADTRVCDLYIVEGVIKI